MYRGQLFCHVWADTIEELHGAAAAAGLKREWFQEPPVASWPHYDCGTKARKALIRNGAIEKSSRDAVAFRQNWKKGNLQ